MYHIYAHHTHHILTVMEQTNEDGNHNMEIGNCGDGNVQECMRALALCNDISH